MVITTSGTLNQDLFSPPASRHFYFSSPYSLPSPAVGVVRDRLWHFVARQPGEIMLRLRHAASSPTAECPSEPCERSRRIAHLHKGSRHARHPAYVHSV